MYFTLEPGETTRVTLTCNGKGGFRYIAFTGTIEDAELFPIMTALLAAAQSVAMYRNCSTGTA